MKYNTYLNYLLIFIGSMVAIYAQAGVKQDVVVLILGIIILMFGLYRISSTLSSKKQSKESHEPNQKDDA
ncbi:MULTISPECIES: hypothetical protein [Xanthomarina]|jgi:Na+/phosphate symporter|uniref:Uncharacterized protein n=1 Tax=Xanthomarina gelatinilytica TaxID=1137281 RepID=M7MCN4_9FLAO|nr:MULTISPECIES: hypothetical protein [Xanthomarina]EMQ93922.1 hypothetical protein D778_01332 [Xanthomarina gelatinilytica]MAL21712.1 hypothetical protein [Xanthomarina sp.]MBF62885.1 hypothetical protein [Xanthomarina sp.]HAB28011.1 hypothetical protein [Xanthomarina gelatinilytica]HAI19516.1 hypothetical protein [Xanthomarina gelatinilytica]|tara:strand:+ start:1673 stop:1882 length:210 start_codon:yes stop_codon:yes gene_type:complete